MLRNQKNKYTMYEGVISYLGENSSKYSDNEEFTVHCNSCKSVINEIELREDSRSKATTGKTKDKEITRISVTDQALAIAGAIYAYAKKSGMITIMESVDLKKSKLDKFRDTGLVIELNSIKDKAAMYSGAISRYGITADKLEEFTNNINLYSKALGAKATGGASKTGASRSLQTLFKEADSLLDSIDRLMENYKLSEKEFYTGYKVARFIKDLGVRHNGKDKKTVTEELQK